MVAIAIMSSSHAIHAQPEVEAFYRGKTINVVIGYTSGGAYSLYARLLAQHLGRHVPGNPAVVPQNMSGAGSRKAGLYLYNVAPKDGTVIGTIGRNEAVAPLIESGLNFDGARFTWIGSITNDNSICLSWHTSRVRTWQDLQSNELTVSGLATGDNTVTVPVMLRNMFGAKLKLVKGYPGNNDMYLAIERGEVEGMCGVSWRPIMSQRRSWMAGKKINVLVEVALERDPTLGSTPLITESIRDPDQLKTLSFLIATQAMARPFLAPPGIPASRRDALRQAFDRTMQDPAFLADARKIDLNVHPMGGAAIDALLAGIYSTPKEIIARAAKAIQE
jgi:tripartite-type tricarboxylate transporter receptor subunit TctC